MTKCVLKVVADRHPSNRKITMLINSQLNDPSLLHEASFLNGEWVQASSGKTFDVEGESVMFSL
jgi:hypothetical protein